MREGNTQNNEEDLWRTKLNSNKIFPSTPKLRSLSFPFLDKTFLFSIIARELLAAVNLLHLKIENWWDALVGRSRIAERAARASGAKRPIEDWCVIAMVCVNLLLWLWVACQWLVIAQVCIILMTQLPALTAEVAKFY